MIHKQAFVVKVRISVKERLQISGLFRINNLLMHIKRNLLMEIEREICGTTAVVCRDFATPPVFKTPKQINT